MLWSSTEPRPALYEAYGLLWQPADTLHPEWWAHWEIQPLQEVYARAQPVLRRQINAWVLEKRGHSDWRPDTLSDRQAQLLRLLPEANTFLIALGLLALGCPGYLRFGHYRRHLMPHLSAAQLDQIAVLLRESHSVADMPAQALPRVCLETGLAMLDTALQADPLWQCLRFAFPRPVKTLPEVYGAEDVFCLLNRLERFL